ncbi:hypothetical protein L596_013368 [Steinernema carpocapsae]|uniref:Uncharacterized protein n=1 Tax=Steinernema carpocapsae TaxID=34508 RepID=A0A4U5P038_STECR|nr:hypothetical protein L596_013368 [Steinernema carpocapsae]
MNLEPSESSRLKLNDIGQQRPFAFDRLKWMVGPRRSPHNARTTDPKRLKAPNDEFGPTEVKNAVEEAKTGKRGLKKRQNVFEAVWIASSKPRGHAVLPDKTLDRLKATVGSRTALPLTPPTDFEATENESTGVKCLNVYAENDGSVSGNENRYRRIRRRVSS